MALLRLHHSFEASSLSEARAFPIEHFDVVASPPDVPSSSAATRGHRRRPAVLRGDVEREAWSTSVASLRAVRLLACCLSALLDQPREPIAADARFRVRARPGAC